MKLDGIWLITIVVWLSNGLGYVVQGAPMNSGETPPKSPEFGVPYDHHLVAPNTFSAYGDHQHHHWDASTFVHEVPHHQEYDQYHLNTYSLPDYSLPTWAQGNVESLEPQHLDISGQMLQDSYSADHLSQSFGQGMQLEQHPYSSGIVGEPYTLDWHQRQGSSSNSAPLPLSPAHIPKESLSYSTRPYRPQAELARRHERLRMYEWQFKYTEKELLRIYLKIAKQWGPLARSTLTAKLFGRLTEQLQYNSQDIDPILFGNKAIIEDRAKASGRRQLKPQRPNRSYDTTMTPEEFIAWITDSRRERIPISSQEGDEDWALVSLNEQEVAEIINRLSHCWESPKEVVLQRLEEITEEEMDPFIPLLMRDEKDYYEQAAQELRDWIIAKDFQHHYS